MRALQAIDAIVIERRDVAVLTRREAVQPGLACMHDQRVDAGLPDRLRERFQRNLRILLVDADAAFHRDRDRDGRLHRGDAFADQGGLGHQAGAEPAILHAVGRAADIQIDLVIAESCAIRADCARSCGSEPPSCNATGCSAGSKRKKPRAVAMQHRAGGDHLGIEQRVPRQQTVEKPAMPVRPIHHRRHGKAARVVRSSYATRLPFSLQGIR